MVWEGGVNSSGKGNESLSSGCSICGPIPRDGFSKMLRHQAFVLAVLCVIPHGRRWADNYAVAARSASSSKTGGSLVLSKLPHVAVLGAHPATNLIQRPCLIVAAKSGTSCPSGSRSSSYKVRPQNLLNSHDSLLRACYSAISRTVGFDFAPRAGCSCWVLRRSNPRRNHPNCPWSRIRTFLGTKRRDLPGGQPFPRPPHSTYSSLFLGWLLSA